MLGNLGITHSHHVHGFKLDFGLRWGKAIEFAVVIAVIGHSQAAKVGATSQSTTASEVRVSLLFDWPRTSDEDIHESPGTLLPVRTGCHVGDADKCAEQIEWLQISAHVAVLNRTLH